MSARRAVEDRLRLAEDRFRTAFVNAPVGMALISAMPATLGRYVQVNEAMCRLVGLTEEAMLALDVQSLTMGDDLDRSLDALSDLLGGRLEHQQAELRYRHASGDPIDVSVSLSWCVGPMALRSTSSPTSRMSASEAVTCARTKRGPAYRRSPPGACGGRSPCTALPPWAAGAAAAPIADRVRTMV